MAVSDFSLIIPLVDAQRSRKTGMAATNLSKLVAARFVVPKGFVLSADAYRSHLWKCGARELTNKAAEATVREQIKLRILDAELPEEINVALADAYKRLSWQLGHPDPKVIVKPSPLEENDYCQRDSHLAACGFDGLIQVIKRIWASVWTTESSTYAELTDDRAIAVVVQQNIKASAEGKAVTVDPDSGNPHKILISLNSEDAPREVDLATLSVNSAEGKDDLSDIVAMVGEQMVLVEDVVAGSVEVDWAHDGEQLWILGARPIVELPSYFPVPWLSGEELNTEWRRITDSPISFFARSCFWDKSSRKYDSQRAQVFNGYVYQREAERGWGARYNVEKEIEHGVRLLDQWEREIAPDLKTRAERVHNRDLETESYPRLQRLLIEAAELARTSLNWLESASYPCIRFPELLRELLLCVDADADTAEILLKGLDDDTVIRDARLHELAERFAVAEDEGKLEDQQWRQAYRRDVEEYANVYSYSFSSIAEAYDPATVVSWRENANVIFRMIDAISRQQPRPTLLSNHAQSRRDAFEVAGKVESHFSGTARKHFCKLFSLSRSWLSARNACEQVCALTTTALRLVMLELGKRLHAADVIASVDDVFDLELDELRLISAKPTAQQRSEVAESIANRKHQKWLESRLKAPESLCASPNEAAELSNAIVGRPAGGGVVTARVRLVRDVAEVSKIEQGEILVVKEATLAWTPLLCLASGLIVEDGPTASGAEVLAREYGMPVVMECRGAMGALKNGQRVTVAGDEGMVFPRGRAG